MRSRACRHPSIFPALRCAALQFPKGFRTIQVKSGKAYIRKTPDPRGDAPPLEDGGQGAQACGAK